MCPRKVGLFLKGNICCMGSLFQCIKNLSFNNYGQDCLFSESDPENSEGSLGAVTL